MHFAADSAKEITSPSNSSFLELDRNISLAILGLLLSAFGRSSKKIISLQFVVSCLVVQCIVITLKNKR